MTTDINNIKYWLCACLMIIGMASFAQSPNIDWTAHSSNSTVATVDVEINTILSRTNAILVWQQSSDVASSIEEFNISSIQGSWDTNSMIGEIKYDISSDNDTGKFTIVGDGQNITMNLDMDQPNAQSITYVFYIDTFNIN